MNKKISPKIVSVIFSVLVICFAVGFYTLAVWTEPTTAPPGGNVDAPINVGGNLQIKQGPLGVHGVFDAHSTTLLASQGGNVGIGTPSPAAGNKLEVAGKIQAIGGDVCTNQGGGACLSTTGGGAYIKVSDQVPSGIDPQANQSDTWTIKRINTENHDDGGYCSIANNQITLAPGTYQCSISSPVRRNCGSHQVRLRNITANVTTLVGTSEQQHDDYSRETQRSLLSGQFTIATTTTFEIQHYKTSGSGWGAAVGLGEVEVYTVAEFWKVK